MRNVMSASSATSNSRSRTTRLNALFGTGDVGELEWHDGRRHGTAAERLASRDGRRAGCAAEDAPSSVSCLADACSAARRCAAAPGDVGADGCGPEARRQERHEMPHRGLDIARIAAAAREGLDALRAARGVVDRAQHEVEPPQDLVGGQRRQALPQRRDEGAARLVEVVGDELREERASLRPRSWRAGASTGCGRRRPESRRARAGRTLRSRTRASGRRGVPRRAGAGARR